MEYFFTVYCFVVYFYWKKFFVVLKFRCVMTKIVF